METFLAMRTVFSTHKTHYHKLLKLSSNFVSPLEQTVKLIQYHKENLKTVSFKIDLMKRIIARFPEAEARLAEVLE